MRHPPLQAASPDAAKHLFPAQVERRPSTHLRISAFPQTCHSFLLRTRASSPKAGSISGATRFRCMRCMKVRSNNSISSNHPTFFFLSLSPVWRPGPPRFLPRLRGLPRIPFGGGADIGGVPSHQQYAGKKLHERLVQNHAAAELGGRPAVVTHPEQSDAGGDCDKRNYQGDSKGLLRKVYRAQSILRAVWHTALRLR